VAADLGGRPPSAPPRTGPEVLPFGIAAVPGEPVLRWDGAATTVAAVERELARIWSSPPARDAIGGEGREERTVAARTSVLNLVVVARRPEIGERVAAEISTLTGRHPSRTLVLVPTDPDGPPWFRAQVRAYCMAARDGAPETCAELVYAVAGGETGRHLAAVVTPLLVHDLPVALWWPGDPPFGTRPADELVALADRLIVDGSAWPGDGLDRLRAVARLARSVEVTDFAVLRQARWREAIAAAFDRADLRPYLGSLRQITVTHASHGGPDADWSTNVVRPVYHVAWLASRLGLRPIRALHRDTRPEDRGRRRASRPAPPGGPADPGRDLRATLGAGRGRTVEVVIRPAISTVAAGTTLRVELLAERRGRELRVEATAEADVVRVRARERGIEVLDRPYLASRRTETDLLAEAIEVGAADHVALDALKTAAALAAPEAQP